MSTIIASDETPNGRLTENESTASSRVFGTYEPLESILLSLPTQHILLAAKVNTSGHSIVDSFCAIHKRLREMVASSLAGTSFVAGQHLRQCMVVIPLQGSSIAIRRIRDTEVVAVLPAPDVDAPVPSHPVFVDGRCRRLKITPCHRLTGTKRLALHGLEKMPDWRVEFWDEGAKRGWKDGQCSSSLSELESMYLERYYGD